MTDELRVGVIGAGIGAGYIAGFQCQPNVEVVALCARTRTRIEPLAKKHAIPYLYTDYQKMLADDALDIVVVATPNNLHYPISMAVLEAGKHIVCDKPLALNAIEAQKMTNRADQAQVKHFVPFIWRFLPAAIYMKEIIESGFLGQTHHVHVRYFNLGWNNLQGPMRWQYDKTQAGSGALANLGSHAIHLIHWWLGGFQRVCAMLTTAVKERDSLDGIGKVPVTVDDTCAFLGELEDSTPVVFHTSSVALVERVNVEIGIFGSEGSLIFQDNWSAEDASTGRINAMRKGDIVPTQLAIPTRLVTDFLDAPDYYTPFRACFGQMTAEVVNAIREDRPAEPNFHDGLRVQEVIDAVLLSADEARWIEV